MVIDKMNAESIRQGSVGDDDGLFSFHQAEGQP
jgi:hypothetical protein